MDIHPYATEFYRMETAVTPAIRNEVVEWFQHHYETNLMALAFFDPVPVRATFPHGDVNCLVVLAQAPSGARERYDMVVEVVLKTIAPALQFVCRIQTIEEIQTLAELRLPLLEIYLKYSEIVYDREQLLNQIKTCVHQPPSELSH